MRTAKLQEDERDIISAASSIYGGMSTVVMVLLSAIDFGVMAAGSDTVSETPAKVV